ncbi:60S ribosomal protein L14 [Sparganum proliferum]
MNHPESILLRWRIWLRCLGEFKSAVLKMVHYTRFVEVGRVVYIVFGSHQKKLAVIVEIIDQNRVLIDGPCTGVPRRPINLKKVHLTGITMKLPPKCGTLGVKDIWLRSKIDKKWQKSKWARKIEKKRIRAGLTDFERFQVMVARQKRNSIIRNFRMRKCTKAALVKMGHAKAKKTA